MNNTNLAGTRPALRYLVALVLCVVCANSYADSPQHASRFDRRVKMVRYNPLDIVTIEGRFGFSTDIQFSSGETVKDIGVGDADGWAFAPSENHLFIKPKAKHPPTNFTVITNKRVYQFEVSAREVGKGGLKQDDDLSYFVIFVYDEDPAVAEKQQAAQGTQVALQTAIDAKPIQTLNKYTLKGDARLYPVSVRDDGRFTYFAFQAGNPIPAVFASTSRKEKEEAVVNFHMEGSTVVVHQLSPWFVIRLGSDKATVRNLGVGQNVAGTPSGAVSPLLERTGKGAQ